jgi:hypothetical protein
VFDKNINISLRIPQKLLNTKALAEEIGNLVANGKAKKEIIKQLVAEPRVQGSGLAGKTANVKVAIRVASKNPAIKKALENGLER